MTASRPPRRSVSFAPRAALPQHPAKVAQPKSATPHAAAISPPRALPPHPATVKQPSTRGSAASTQTKSASSADAARAVSRAAQPMLVPRDELSTRLGPLLPPHYHLFFDVLRAFGLGKEDMSDIFRTAPDYFGFMSKFERSLSRTRAGLGRTPQQVKRHIRSSVREQTRILYHDPHVTEERYAVLDGDVWIWETARALSPIKRIPKNEEIHILDLVHFLACYVLEGMMLLERRIRKKGEANSSPALANLQTLAKEALRSITKSDIPVGLTTSAVVPSRNRVARYRFQGPGKRVFLLAVPEAGQVGIHESMHFASSPEFAETFGSNFNEAATEYFARRIFFAGDPTDVPLGAYAELVDLICALIAVRAIRIDDLVQAYFFGNTAAMERTLRRFFGVLYDFAVNGNESTLTSAVSTRFGSYSVNWLNRLSNRWRLFLSYVWD